MISAFAVLALPFTIAAAPRHPAKPAAPADSSMITTVTVQNDRSVPVTVYVQDPWQEYKLGVIGANATAPLALRASAFAKDEIQFFVQPARGIETSTKPIDVVRGERIGLVVAPH